MVSLIIHVILLLILALVPLTDAVQGPLTLVFGAASAGVPEFNLSGDRNDTSEMSAVDTFDELQPIELKPLLTDVELPELVPKEVIEDGSEAAATPVLANIPVGIRDGLSGRSGSLKDALLEKYGGTAETEAAVELGLQWLAKQQKSDGSWSLTGPYSLGGAAENRTAATAMAINAFLGAGYHHKEGKYAEKVKLGLAYLKRRQQDNGFFSKREPSRQQMYAQAIASIAVIEAWGMTGDSDLRIAAGRAIAFAEWAQSDLRGWRYNPREEADLSVTGWFVMALITGKMTGLTVNEEKLQSVGDFLDSVSFEEDSRYAYTTLEPASLSMTAEGILCRLYLGWPSSHPALLAAVRDDFLPTRPSLEQEEYSIYYWYYATQVMHHVGGPSWKVWNDSMKVVIPAMQEKAGDEAGSWDPSNDIYGASGGRLYMTCLNLYCLEVYYRHLALYDVK